MIELISCIAVTKSYRQGFLQRKSKPALLDFNLSIHSGEVVGIVGPNGAGKSTVIKILMGFIRPDSGQVTIAGRNATTPASHATVGYLPENPCLYRNLSLSDHLNFAAGLAKIPAREKKQRIDQLLTTVDLTSWATTPIRRFSKGMTQRAALAYALFLQPQILILDEPMSGLDPIGRQLVVDIIRDYHSQGNTILFCSHILSDVERICNRIAIMNKGKLAVMTTPELLQQTEPSSGNITPLESLFLRTLREANA